jgi:hypothetical protein
MNFTNFIHSLTEKRSHYEVNHNELTPIDYIKSIKDSPDMFDTYMTFTHVPKLSINPLNRYHTPTGIYCYPLSDYIYSIIDDNNFESIPFQADAPYVIFFKATGKVFDVKKYSKANWDRDYKIITRLYKDEVNRVNDTTEYERHVDSKVDQSIPDKTAHLKKVYAKVYEIESKNFIDRTQHFIMNIMFNLNKNQQDIFHIYQSIVKNKSPGWKLLSKNEYNLFSPVNTLLMGNGQVKEILTRLSANLKVWNQILLEVTDTKFIEGIKERMKLLSSLESYILKNRQYLKNMSANKVSGLQALIAKLEDNGDIESVKIIKEFLKLVSLQDNNVQDSRGEQYKNILQNNRYEEGKTFQDLFHETTAEAADFDIKERPSIMLWYFTHKLAMILSVSRLNLSVHIWKSILNKSLGYIGAVDHGQGLIHDAEPHQAVFFNTNDLKLHHILKNTNKTYQIKQIKTLNDLKALSDDEFIETFNPWQEKMVTIKKVHPDLIYKNVESLHYILSRMMSLKHLSKFQRSWINEIIDSNLEKYTSSVQKLKKQYPGFIQEFQNAVH